MNDELRRINRRAPSLPTLRPDRKWKTHFFFIRFAGCGGVPGRGSIGRRLRPASREDRLSGVRIHNSPERRNIAVALATCIALAGVSAPADDAPAKPIRVLIQTDKGDMEVELEPAKAPATVANFLRYVDGHYYDGGKFHRTVTPDN